MKIKTLLKTAFLIDSCFSGHMNNIGRLVEENKSIVAGPMDKNVKNTEGSLS
jgi:hypothetical protein